MTMELFSVDYSGGDGAQADYTVVVNTPLEGITGLRLDALTDAGLPNNGPGYSGNGNFILSELEVEVEPSMVTLDIPLQNATATQLSKRLFGGGNDQWSQWGVATTDGPLNPEQGSNQTAVWETKVDIPNFPRGTRLTLNMSHLTLSGYFVGKFRLSVTNADRTSFADGAAGDGDLGTPSIWTALTPSTATVTNDSDLNIESGQRSLSRVRRRRWWNGNLYHFIRYKRGKHNWSST